MTTAFLGEAGARGRVGAVIVLGSGAARRVVAEEDFLTTLFVCASFSCTLMDFRCCCVSEDTLRDDQRTGSTTGAPIANLALQFAATIPAPLSCSIRGLANLTRFGLRSSFP